MLFFITLNYFEKYRESKRRTTLLLMISFAIIAVSQIIFYCMKFDEIFYAVAEIVQLFGYVLLLITFVMILLYGHKINYLDIKKIRSEYKDKIKKQLGSVIKKKGFSNGTKKDKT